MGERQGEGDFEPVGGEEPEKTRIGGVGVGRSGDNRSLDRGRSDAGHGRMVQFRRAAGEGRGHRCAGQAERTAGAHLGNVGRPRGITPGSPSETGLKQDAEAVWRYVTEERGVAPDRIVVYGESLGGGVACHLVGDTL